MENQNKYLLLARRAREENNSEDARKYYDLVRTEDPDNAEAKFFYSYYRLLDGTKGEAYHNFVAFCNGIDSTLALIMASNDSDADKKAFYKTIVSCLENASDIAFAANRDIGGGNGVSLNAAYHGAMDSLFAKIKPIFEDDVDFLLVYYKYRKRYDPIGVNNLLRKYKLGDEIEAKYASVPKLMAFAVEMWKECISYQQTYYNSSDSKACAGLQEKYAEKVKKYEPAYVMPAKAGCITIGKK